MVHSPEGVDKIMLSMMLGKIVEESGLAVGRRREEFHQWVIKGFCRILFLEK